MSPERESLMTVAQIAARLTVSETTVRRLFVRRELRGVRIGSQWRARPEDVERLATPAETVTTRDVAGRHAMSSPAPKLGEGPSYRIFSDRPWEVDGHGRSVGTKKTASQTH